MREGGKMRRREDEKKRKYEDEKIRYRPPLLEASYIQILPGKKILFNFRITDKY